jgi:hypothetical protein
MSLRLLLLMTVLPLAPITVLAGEMPKEGTDSFTNTWMVTTSKTMKVGDRTLGTYEVSGVHQNVQGEAKTDMGMRCLGIYDVAGKAPKQEHGACTFTDNDGDEIMATYERKTAEGGVETLVAGTGKFAGISGTGEWTVLKFPLKADDKLSRGIVSEKVHWKIRPQATGTELTSENYSPPPPSDLSPQ